MRRTIETEAVPRSSGNNSTAHHRGGTQQRQLFDYRKDDPVKFSALARSPQPSHGRPAPTTRSTGDHVSAASTSSYAPSVASSLTLSSTTDSSASSALFDGQSQGHEQTSSNAFSMQLKLLYRQITELENRIKQEDSQDEAEDSLEGRVLIRGKETENYELEKEKWQRRLADHKMLADIISELLTISLAPSVPASLRQIPTKYNMIVRLWTYAFHRLLESLRRASFSSYLALEHLQDFIYYAYTFYTGLLEQRILDNFRNGWLEALGDLARYRMAVAAMITGGVGTSTGTILTSKAILDAGINGSANGHPSTEDVHPPTSAVAAALAVASTDMDAAKAKMDDSPSPSVGVAAARLLEIEPEKELWRAIARDWYASGLAEQPGTGKLHHHLGLLSREMEGEELKGIYHFVKSMTALNPFPTARESVLPLWSGPAQSRRFQPDACVSDLFVLLHGMLFTNIQLDDFQSVLARFIERLELDGAQEREWIMMAVVNLSAVLEYGKPGGTLRRTSGIAARESDPNSGQNQNAVRVVAKKANGVSNLNISGSQAEKMDIDDEQGDSQLKQPSRTCAEQLSSLNLGDFDQALPMHFALALQLTFHMLTYVLRSPSLKPSAYTHSDVNPYLTVILTFLVTILKHPIALQVLERFIPWEELSVFLSKVPRIHMIKQGLWNNTSQSHSSPSSPQGTSDRGKWSMLTNKCAPPLPEDWCMRGMEWVGRRVFERGYWKTESTGEECRTDVDVLGKTDHVDITDGRIEDDDGVDDQISSMHVDVPQASHPRTTMTQVERRWVRILRCAVGIADVVDGFTWQTGTKVWKVEGKLMEKVNLWKEQDRAVKEEDEKRRMKQRQADESMEVDEEGIVESEESEDDEADTEEVRELKARRRYLRTLLQSAQDDNVVTSSARRSRPTARKTMLLPSLCIIPGYTVLVIDTNILLSSLSVFASLVESLRWTIIVPVPVVMELDGLATNSSPLGEAATTAVAYIASHIRTHGQSLKVQTSKGNYLASLAVRTEQLQFSGTARGADMDRNMDDLILRAAIWQDEHWVDRSTLLGQNVAENVADAVKVVLLSLDRNLRLKARSRHLQAAGEKDIASILTNGK
ncbi:hypothetical protein APHAL10511_007007 [Amanita phalloides]|nr:hypothetical protein APHAL10511_007007 [Amanita phalloides]